MLIGFIGLGAMGSAMAANLVQAGYKVRVWNRSPEAVQNLVSQGAEAVDSPCAAARVEVLISMLADDAATRSVIVDSGVLEVLGADSIHINMATVSIALAKKLAALHAERGIGYVSAPVLGRVDVAAAGNLNILAAGPAALIAKIQPVLDILGQKTWWFGDAPEQANAVKIAANFTLACAIEAIAESAALVRSHGIPASDYIDLLTGTLFSAPAYKGYGALIAQERFAPAGFRLSLGLKDIRLALEAGEATHVPLPFASVLRDNLLDAIAQGDADLDWAALAKVAARHAGLS
ncbi:MAG TPA: NAD(P)-dependent oxidoreductase [Nitrococcus sp.]|nr:NAD(P)-dependent oxidoreductase [Nitrococcus sp.]